MALECLLENLLANFIALDFLLENLELVVVNLGAMPPLVPK